MEEEQISEASLTTFHVFDEESGGLAVGHTADYDQPRRLEQIPPEPTSGQRASFSGTAIAQISAGTSRVQIQALVTVHHVTRTDRA
jgi:hypothetical protein